MGISVSGLSSGIDWQSILEKLKTLSEQRLSLIEDQKETLNDRLTAWKDLGTKLGSLKDAMNNLRDSWDFDIFTSKLTSSQSSVAADSLLSVTVGSGAASGVFRVQVLQTADYQKEFSESFSSTTADAGKTGYLTINGKDVSLDGKSLAQIQSDINALNAGVSANILKVNDNDYKLVITSKTSGANGFTFDASNATMSFTEQTGKNAVVTIDGVTIERSNNTITDALQGVTLDLRSADASTTLTLQIDRDYGAIQEKMKTFVNAYNDVLDEIAKHITSSTNATATAGVLNADFTLQRVKANIQSVYLKGQLFDLGITIDDNNRLKFDTSTFTQALQSDFTSTSEKIRSFANSMYKQLDNLTDPISGTLTLKEDNLTKTIKKLDDRINSEQTRINRQIEAMTKQFQAMESALAEMQSQSQWLSAQLSAWSA